MAFKWSIRPSSRLLRPYSKYWTSRIDSAVALFCFFSQAVGPAWIITFKILYQVVHKEVEWSTAYGYKPSIASLINETHETIIAKTNSTDRYYWRGNVSLLFFLQFLNERDGSSVGNVRINLSPIYYRDLCSKRRLNMTAWRTGIIRTKKHEKKSWESNVD